MESWSHSIAFRIFVATAPALRWTYSLCFCAREWYSVALVVYNSVHLDVKIHLLNSSIWFWTPHLRQQHAISPLSVTPKTRELQEVALTINSALNLSIASALQYGKGETSIQNPNLHTCYETIGCLKRWTSHNSPVLSLCPIRSSMMVTVFCLPMPPGE